MLVLTRRAGEAIQVGRNVAVTILRIRNGAVRIGIDAPSDLHIKRTELDENVAERTLGPAPARSCTEVCS